MENRTNNAFMLLLQGLFGLLILLMTQGSTSGENAATPTLTMRPEHLKTKKTDEELYGSYKDKSLKELLAIRKEFFKSGQIPTGSNEVKRLWQWYRTMDEKDPTFRSKTPIEFYGKVVDQYGSPVSEAVVDMSWGKGTNCIMNTAMSGTFEFSGQKGKYLDVYVHKQGYVTGADSRRVFQYADFFDRDFHIPDPISPEEFRLMKLEDPEPMYVCSLRPKVDVIGTVAWIDVASGKRGDVGDVGFAVLRDSTSGAGTPGYTLNILTHSGGGVIITNEEFMFHAPEIGYTPRVELREVPSDPNRQTWQSPKDLKLYLKTADEKYAAMTVSVGQFARPEAWIDIVIFFNPSGSRNLELGPNNRLDAGEAKRIRDKAQQTGAYH